MIGALLNQTDTFGSKQCLGMEDVLSLQEKTNKTLFAMIDLHISSKPLNSPSFILEMGK